MVKTFKNKKVDKKTNADVERLGKRIKELRIKLGYTNYEFFAYDNEIARAQYGKYEKGEDMRYTSLLKVIRALGVTPKEFFSKDFDDL
ncbi:MAG: helix-turn-helix transcriptional regulator [Bacteroidetes bacterium]|nr:helix-turn-helix transcriptional regulator [Bacteroidota bacterium]